MLILGLEDPAGADALHRRRVPVGVRQDQPGDARAADVDAGLEGVRPSATTSRGCGPATDGRLWAVNPEAGFFGVVPGTSRKTNPNAFDMIQRNTIYTNVALRPDGTPWWEGHDDPPPAEALDWQGRPWTPAVDREGGASRTAASRRRRRSARRSRRSSRTRRACRSTRSSSARGGSGACRSSTRRATGSTARSSARRSSSETTAAATGKVGVLRRDPMAMWPFCGYNMGDYFGHWLDIGAKLTKPPKIFRVNWFRTDEDGQVPVARLRRQPARAEVDPRALRRARAGRRDRRSAPCRRSTRSIAPA